MQHHVHSNVNRPAPHMRPGHHHHHGHGHPLPPLHPGLEQPPPPQSQRDHHHARLNHHHHHAQTTTNANAAAAGAGAAYPPQNSNNNNNNQMQKIRQQHQHLNSNSNGHSGKCNQPPPPPPQAYTAAALSYNQLPHPPPPHHMAAAAHLGGYAAHPPPHYAYMSQAKPSKYNNSHYSANNNNNNSSYAPKAILQNTYRHANKSHSQNPPATPAAVPEANLDQPSSSSSNNIVIATDEESVVEPALPESSSLEALPETDDCLSSSEHIDAALPNEDGSSGRNAKDKTPMCLVNELARYNKITHQYRLTGERGPAHCKTFTVTLKLGEEEYSADGFKIKKAQHLAASKAIEETKYKHPPPKIRRSDEASTTRTHITPTVELNALAMKLGQRTYYLLDPTQIPPTEGMLPPEYGGTSLLPTPANGLPAQPTHPPPPPPPPYAMRQRHNNGYVSLPAPPPMHPHGGMYAHQRAYAPKYPSRYALPPPLGAHHMAMHGHGPYAPLPVTPCKITLFVGKQKFVGIGRTLQQAKHDAAARALQMLKSQAANTNPDAETLEDSLDESDKKSPISQVHEIGIKRNMTVHFKVLREEGPAHMKNFITACIVGAIVTEGEGNGKKLSKKRAAEKMLGELQKLPPLTPTKQTPMKRIKVKTTPGKNPLTETAAATGATVVTDLATPLGKLERRKRLNAPIKEKLVELDDAENPITKLIQLQQTRKEKEPIFELIAKNGNETSRRREFVMEVSANGSTARGTGNSKKLAKRNAAQALLELLEEADHNVINTETEQSPADVQATAKASSASAPILETTNGVDVPMVSTPAGPVPGILILRQNKKPAKKKEPVLIVKAQAETKEEETSSKEAAAVVVPTATTEESSATETTSESSLNTSTGSNTSGVSSNSSNAATNVHMKEQLLYLSKLLDFEVNFSDYPKGNHNEFLTIVTLSTNPPQICHGVGKSSEESQNDAARNALKILSELGLNNAKK